MTFAICSVGINEIYHIDIETGCILAGSHIFIGETKVGDSQCENLLNVLQSNIGCS